ncbi:MAG: cobalamin-dependent protein [Gemmatimonadetes bacterium]|nr:cobalamin-dependent protein [Gemmatimonadota bacterium]
MSAAESFAQAYLDAVLAGSRQRARAVVDDAKAQGVDIRALYLHIFQPTLREVGRLWQENRITVADEHLATAITQALMAQVFSETFARTEGHARTMIAACLDSERHEIGLRMVCDLLEMEGWETTFLGATVPSVSLAQMVQTRRPDALALSVSLATHVPRLTRAISALRDALGEATPVIVVGGRPFLHEPALAETVGADVVARDPTDAVERLKEHFASAAGLAPGTIDSPET